MAQKATKTPKLQLTKTLSRGWSKDMVQIWNEVAKFVLSENKHLRKNYPHLSEEGIVVALAHNAGCMAAYHVEHMEQKSKKQLKKAKK